MTHRDQELDGLLQAVSQPTVEALFAHLPPGIRMGRALNLPARLPEWAIERRLRTLAGANHTTLDHMSFLGGGCYQHHVPPLVDALASRGEFLTAYTPYQPELSQGLLQVLWEYQQYARALTGLPVTNGSCYDGTTALAEGVAMAVRHAAQGRAAGDGLPPALCTGGLWPQAREVLETFCWGGRIPLRAAAVRGPGGATDLDALERSLRETRARALVFQTPNRFGVLEPVGAIAEVCRRQGVTSVLLYHPLLAGRYPSPGQLGVDIVAAEGQCLGLPLSAGGPGLGILACGAAFFPFLPGRVVGQVQGRFGFIREEREQHRSRSLANSNICTNQAHCAVRAAIFLKALGGPGFASLSRQNHDNAHYFMHKLTRIAGVARTFTGPFFNEFTISLAFPAGPFLAALRAHRIFAGLDVGDCPAEPRLLIAVTEVHTREDLDWAAGAFAACARSQEPDHGTLAPR